LFHHPAFQSVAMPLAMTLLATLLLMAAGRAERGAPWVALGGVVGLCFSLALLPGFEWPASSRALKLPWIVLAGGLLSATFLALNATQTRRWLFWGLGVAIWAVASVWLSAGVAAWPMGAFWALAGAGVLAAQALPRHRPVMASSLHSSAVQAGAVRVASAAALAVASLGLAALAAMGGSLLLAQLALMLAVVSGVTGLWAWARPAANGLAAPAGLLPLGLAWLVVAQSLAPNGVTGAVRMGVLILAFAVPWLLGRTPWAARHPRWMPWTVAAVAALPVLVAVGLLLMGGAGGVDGPAGEAGDSDADPYYKPAWD
jgi:hypothetical protein